MKLATEHKKRTDVRQYFIDPQFETASVELPTALTVDRHAGDCINPATGALVTSTDTDCAVVADFTPAGSKTVVCFYKHVILFQSGLVAADPAGLTNAISILELNPYIEFAK